MGTPEEIYNEPENAFVADFIGDSNILDGVMLEDRVVVTAAAAPVGATAAPAAEIMTAVVPRSSLSAVIKAKMVYHNISC